MENETNELVAKTVTLRLAILVPATIASVVLVSSWWQEQADRNERQQDRDEFMREVRENFGKIEAIVGDIRPKNVLDELREFRTEAGQRFEITETRTKLLEEWNAQLMEKLRTGE